MIIKQIAVLGAGTMGRGIAETAALAGYSVLSVEINPGQREAAAKAIRASVEKGIQKGKLKVASADEVLNRITWEADLSAAAKADFVIEAITENEAVKTDILQQLDRICGPHIILATNTSSISITRLAAATKRPEMVIGMHFFNPVPIMAPVEIVRGLVTSIATIDVTKELAEKMGKQAFVVQDHPGFVVNRILMPLINEAIFALQEGVGDATAIDSLTKLGLNHPMGPLQLADLIGLDVCLSVMRVLHKELGDQKFHPCPLLIRMVDAGQLGRKTGKGFYQY